MDTEHMYVDAREIMDDIEKFHLASYFMETRKNAESKSALAWLKSIDTDTVNLIVQYAKKLGNQDSGAAAKNTGIDVFDKPYKPLKEENIFEDGDEDEDDDEEDETLNKIKEEQAETEEIIEPKDEGQEVYSLTILLLAWENGRLQIPFDLIEIGINSITAYAAMEILRREKLVNIRGNGTLLSDNTKCLPTKKAKLRGKKIMKKIKDANKKTEYIDEGSHWHTPHAKAPNHGILSVANAVAWFKWDNDQKK